ncbi:MAG: hypothetical protein ACRENE_09655 [Polyangiaceae bacterium]
MRATSRHLRRVGLAALLMLLRVAYSAAAGAEEKVVALYVDGPDARAVRAVVGDALPAGAKVLDETLLRAELAHQGVRAFGKEIDADTMTRIRKAARVMGLQAVVIARVRHDRAGRHVRLIVVDAWKAQAALSDARVDLKSHGDDVDAVKVALGPSVGSIGGEESASGSAPSAPETEPSQAPPPPAAAASAARPAKSEPPASDLAPATAGTEPASPEATSQGHAFAESILDVSVGDEIAGRRFQYNNGIAPGARVASTFPAPGVSVAGTVFPFAWRDVGLSAEYLRIYSAANTSGSPGDDLWPSSYAVSARVRLHPGRDPHVLLGFSLGYACTTFTSVGPPDAELPNVTYRSVRPAVDVRVPIGIVSILASGAFHILVAPGDISTRFYDPSGYGFSTELGGAVKLGSKLEMRLAGWYERYYVSFSLPAGVRFDAGGASDQLYGARLALALIL